VVIQLEIKQFRRPIWIRLKLVATIHLTEIQVENHLESSSGKTIFSFTKIIFTENLFENLLTTYQEIVFNDLIDRQKNVFWVLD
jgi:hypothetical protein